MRLKWNSSNRYNVEETADTMEMGIAVEGVPKERTREPNQKAQRRLLEALRKDDIQSFTDLLKEEVDVDAPYENQRTLLMEACLRAEGEKFIKVLLDENADPNKADTEQQTALHIAAYERHYKCMKLLLKDPRTDVNKVNNLEFTPLHCATIAFWDNAHAGDHTRCIQLLMNCQDLEVNRPDKYGDSAVWNALQNSNAGATHILKVMLMSGNKNLNVDVWHVRNGSTMRKEIETKFPKLKNLLPKLSESITGKDPHMQMLLKRRPNLETFRTFLPKDIDKRYGEPYHCTCLELACRRNDLKGFVKELLDAKANPNQPTKIYNIPLVHQAMANANYDALKALMSHDHVDFCITNEWGHSVLHVAAHRQCSTQEEELEMKKCVNLMLGQKDEEDAAEREDEDPPEAGEVNMQLLIDARDNVGDTALHDAARYDRRHVVLPLLRGGANVLALNHDKKRPLDFIDADTLRLFLDEQIRGSGQSRSEEFKITMRYNFLVTQEESLSETETVCNKSCTGDIRAFPSETDTVYHISRIYHLRELLQHPVVSSFLDLKWHLIRWFYYINLAVYIIFILVFTVYIIVINEDYDVTNCSMIEEENEKEIPPFNISDSPSIGFVSFKCETFTNYCSLNSTHICLIDVNVRTVMLMILLRTLCICSLVALLLIEVIQFVTGYWRYITDSENIIELFMIIVSACALSYDFNTSITKQHISAIAILIAWLELVLLSGRMPLLSIQLEVLKKVSFTFLRFMAWYSLLVIAFVLSFHIIFRKSKDEQHFFVNPGMTVLKTIAMMIGELETSNLTFHEVRITSQIIYLVFVFLIIVILMNVLSGLAVSDTQAIVDDAKIQRLVSLVKLISYFERIFIMTWLCFSKDFCQNYMQPMIRVFSSNAKQKQIDISKKGKVIANPYEESKVRIENGFEIDQETMSNAMKILSNKDKKTDMDQLMHLLDTLKGEIGRCQQRNMEEKYGTKACSDSDK